MGDFMDFYHTLENISKLCEGDERVVYTLIYAFDYPHSHRVQGELQTGGGQITGALRLCPDFDDKHLEWPVKLKFKLLAYMNGNTEVLGTREIVWDVTNVKDSFEQISKRNSVEVSLQDLKEKDMIGADDSVTFFWSVKLSYPQTQDIQSAASTSEIGLKEAAQGNLKFNTDTNSARNLEHRSESKTDGVCDSQRDAIIVPQNCDNTYQIQDRKVYAELENMVLEVIRLYSIDMIPHSMNLDIEISKFFQKQPAGPDVTEKDAGIRPGSSLFKDDSDEHNSILSQTKHQDPEPQFTDAPHPDVAAPGPVGLRPETVRMLLEDCNKFSLGSQRKLTPLMHESYCGDSEKVLELFKDENPDINIQGPWGMTALMFASWTGKDKSVQFLLEQKADVNITNDLGMSALMIATMRGHTEIVQLLIENNADPHIMTYMKFPQTGDVFESMSHEAKQEFSQLMSCRLTCLMIATALDERRTVKLLLQHSKIIHTETTNGMTAFKAACYGGHSQILGLLLEHGADVNSRDEQDVTPLMLASVSNKVDIITMLLMNNANVNSQSVHGTTALMVAAHSGCDKVAKVLIENGAVVNAQDSKGRSALMFASAGCHLKVVKVLLSSKENSYLLRGDNSGVVIITPGDNIQAEIAKDLHTRCQIQLGGRKRHRVWILTSIKGQDALIEMSLQNSENVNLRDRDGKAALVHALIPGNSDIINLLLDHGAVVDISDRHGKTPLMYASINDDTCSIKLLLKHGADVNVMDTNRNTSLMHASKVGHLNSIKLLLQAGANLHSYEKEGMASPDLGASVNMAKEESRTPLTEASRYEHLDVVKLFLDRQSQVTKNDVLNALLAVPRAGCSEVVQILLDDLSRRQFSEEQDSEEPTPSESSSSGDPGTPVFFVKSKTVKRSTTSTNQAEPVAKRTRGKDHLNGVQMSQQQ